LLLFPTAFMSQTMITRAAIAVATNRRLRRGAEPVVVSEESAGGTGRGVVWVRAPGDVDVDVDVDVPDGDDTLAGSPARWALRIASVHSSRAALSVRRYMRPSHLTDASQARASAPKSPDVRPGSDDVSKRCNLAKSELGRRCL